MGPSEQKELLHSVNVANTLSSETLNKFSNNIEAKAGYHPKLCGQCYSTSVERYIFYSGMRHK